jgi:hypothetical protein
MTTTKTKTRAKLYYFDNYNRIHYTDNQQNKMFIRNFVGDDTCYELLATEHCGTYDYNLYTNKTYVHVE